MNPAEGSSPLQPLKEEHLGQDCHRPLQVAGKPAEKATVIPDVSLIFLVGEEALREGEGHASQMLQDAFGKCRWLHVPRS